MCESGSDFVLKEGLEVEQLIQVVAVETEVKAMVGANGRVIWREAKETGEGET